MGKPAAEKANCVEMGLRQVVENGSSSRIKQSPVDVGMATELNPAGVVNTMLHCGRKWVWPS